MSCQTTTLGTLAALRDAMYKRAAVASSPELTEEFLKFARNYQAEIDLLLAQNI